MKRNIEKATREGERIVDRNGRLDIGVADVMELRQRALDPDELIEVITDVYRAGLAVGYRNGRKHEVLRSDCGTHEEGPCIL